MKRFVITGTGRSGTRYMSVLLTRMGIPTGHQNVFNANCLEDDFKPKWGQYRGDSSGLAAPHLLSLPEDTLVVHLTRNPGRVMHSLIEQKHLPGQDKNPSIATYEKFCPQVCEFQDLMKRAACLWVGWNLLVEEAKDRPYFMHHRVEDHPMQIVRAIAIHIDWHHTLRPEVVLDVPTNVGTAGKTGEILLNAISGDLGVELREMARRYGYASV